MTNNEGILKDPSNAGGYIRIAPEQTTEILGRPSRDDTRVVFYGGNGYEKGATLMLNGVNYGTTLGAFTLHAHDGTNRSVLAGYSDGSLKLNSGTIDSILEFGGDYTTSSYLKYNSGVLICWGTVNVANNAATTVTIPHEYCTTGYNVQLTRFASSTTQTSDAPVFTRNKTNTSFEIYTIFNTSTACSFLTIGRWK